MTIRVLVADDQSMVRAGFRMLLSREQEIEVVAEASNGLEAVAKAARFKPTVILMDIRMPELDGLQATRRIIAADDTARILILTTFDFDQYVYEALRAGAGGFLLKDDPPEQLLAAIRIVAGGDALLSPAVTKRVIRQFARIRPAAPPREVSELTERERDVFRLIARGYSNAEISRELYISDTTVKTHITHILGKLNLRDRVQAVVLAYETGLFDADAPPPAHRHGRPARRPPLSHPDSRNILLVSGCRRNVRAATSSYLACFSGPRSSLTRTYQSTMPEAPVMQRVGWGFVALYTLAYMSTCLLFLAPLLVTLALKVNSLVGIERAPDSLALVAGAGALLAMVGNPFFGRMSDRTASPLGMRRPWMVIGLAGGSLGILIVALAPSIPVVLAGWCIAQLFFNALLATMVAVLPDQVPSAQRGQVAGILGVCLPIASVCGTFLVKLFTGNLLAMFLGPCAIGGFFILLFAATLTDRRLARADKPKWSLREFASTFYVNPGKNRDFSWAFASRFLFVMAYAFLATYQAYYLLHKLGTAKAEVPEQIFLGTLVQSAALVAASLLGGKVSDRTGRRKIFVLAASVVYGLALFVIAAATSFSGFLVGMAIGGLGFGVYTAVDLALVVDVLPDRHHAAKDLGVFNIAGALPFAIAPAIAPVILAIGHGSYGLLYMVAGLCAVVGAVAILPVRRVR
jgi:DNA-binding NarL/FixJ family response regulator/MFS family permease